SRRQHTRSKRDWSSDVCSSDLDSLGMNSELLEYLVEYCAQNGHTSVRYLEAVALSWHEKGIRTVPDAQDFCASYTRDSFAVMKRSEERRVGKDRRSKSPWSHET